MFNKIKKNYFLLISTFLIFYFFFNLLDGERGLFSYFKKKEILLTLQNEETYLKNTIKDFKYKNLLLSNNLDLDYVEILINDDSSSDETFKLTYKFIDNLKSTFKFRIFSNPKNLQYRRAKVLNRWQMNHFFFLLLGPHNELFY